MKKLYLILLVFLIFTCLFSDSPAQTPQYYNSNVVGGGNAFPFSVTAGKLVQFLVLPGELNQPTPAPSGTITKFYVFCATATITFTNLTIKMGQSTITTLPTGVFYTGPLDTVYFNASVTLTSTSGTFTPITLTRPHVYDNTKSLIIEISQCGASATGMSIYQTTLTGFRRTYNQTAGGCNYIYQGQGAQLMNCGIDISAASTITNRTLKLQTPGSSTTYVQIPYNAGMVGFGNNITIEAWINPGGTTTAATVLNKGVASFDYQLGVSLSTMLPFFRAGSTIATCTFPVVAGIWQHLAVVSNGSTVTFYLNGVPRPPVPMAMTLGSSANEMRIGRGNADAGSGMLDEIRLWSVARTASEIYSNMCNKWVPNNATGLKAKWHFDSTYVDSVSGWNGNPMGLATFDTITFCPIVTNISGNGVILPKNYKLEQNYPNPFNPTTNIRFSIPKSGYVEIKIYDMLGKEVATLVRDPYLAGEYIVGFNASSLSSGIYFYRITVNGFIDTKKMMLIK